MKLLIVIPALNEEQSIESIITRTHEAIPNIIEGGVVSSVKIVAVSDGSTDKTVELAQKHSDKSSLIIFKENKGYGAAIKEGWEYEDADLLAFLDADGTCNPNFFRDLCDLLSRENADIVLGCRLNKNSEMPFIRRFGNTVFAIMLSFAAGKRIKDTASGMRVVKKASLRKIYPLPDGLHFTPAMSARAVLSSDLNIQEIDMPYKEREGESKLSAWKDGKRFLKVIMQNMFVYMPHKFMNIVGILALLMFVIILLPSGIHYIQNSELEEWMIYRFIAATFFGVIGTLSFSISSLTKKILHYTLNTSAERKKGLLYYIFESKTSLILALILIGVGIALIYDSLVSRATSGHTDEHWSRYISMLYLTLNGFILIGTFLVHRVFRLMGDRIKYMNGTNE